MGYYMMPSATSVGNHSLVDNLNKIINGLTKQEFWSKRVANQCRILNLRGWGRWLDCESDFASDEIICLEKICVDKLGYTPKLDFTKLVDTQISLADITAFKGIFEAWENYKQALIDTVNLAIKETASVDIQLYKKLICLADRLQDDKVRIRMCYNRLNMADWGKHDLMIVSMVIHKYFEHEHKQGDNYNFNLG